jgi:16S rRNA (guanine527-N7)-methyltransferase
MDPFFLKMQYIKDILVKGTEEIGVTLTPQALESYLFYIKELKKWNRRINFTALRGEREIAVKHFLDSLTVAPYLQGAKKILDIGTGAGFPGLPLKILSPSIELLLLESSQKKIFFLRHIVRGLKLKGVEIIHGRAQQKEIIEKYARHLDLVLSRALADLPTFLELAIPYTKKGGCILGMRGKRGEKELQDLNWERLGLRLIATKKLTLPFLQAVRFLFLFQLQENPFSAD